MELVNIVPCGLLCRTVDGHSVPHLILYDQHTDLFKLLSKLFNIETDKTIIQLDIGSVVEDVETTVNVDFKSGRNTLCLVLLLCSQAVVQISEDGHIFGNGICKILLIHNRKATVNHRNLHRFQTCLSSHNQLTQRKDKVTFQSKRIFIVGVVKVDIHRIYVVLTCWRNTNNLSLHLIDQRIIFPLRVTNDNIVISDKECVCHFPLCRKRFTRTGCSENQSIGIFELFAVNHNHVV